MGIDVILKDTRARVALSLLGTGLGVAATVYTGGLGAPGIMSNAAGGLFGNLLISDLFQWSCQKTASANDLIRNHDLAKLTAHAIAQTLLQLAGETNAGLNSAQKRLLKQLANHVGDQWLALLGESRWQVVLDQLTVQNLPGYFQGLRPDASEPTNLSPRQWSDALKEMGRAANVARMYDPVLEIAGECLHRQFPAVMYGLIKEDFRGETPTKGRAYAALHLTMLSTVLERLPTETIRKQEREEDQRVIVEAIALLLKQADERRREFETGLAPEHLSQHAAMLERLDGVCGSLHTTTQAICVELKIVSTQLAAVRKGVGQVHKTAIRTFQSVQEVKTDTSQIKERQQSDSAKIDEILRVLQSQRPDDREMRIAELESQLSEARKAIEAVAAAAEAGDEQARADLASGEPKRVQAARIRLRDREAAKLAALDEKREASIDTLVSADREIAAVAYLRGDISQAEESLKSILARRPDDLVATNLLGLLEYFRGNLSEAESKFRRVTVLAADDISWQGIADGNMGLIFLTRGELDRAEELFQKSLEIDERLGRQEGMASRFCNLGVIYQARGELDRAEQMLLKSLAIEERLRRPEGLSNVYSNLGTIYQAQGDSERAERTHLKSLKISEQVGRQAGMAAAYGNLAGIYHARGDLDRAEQMLLKGLEIDQRLGQQEGIAISYGSLGIIYRMRGELDRAEQMLLKSLAIEERLGRQKGIANRYDSLGMLYQNRGELDRAEQMHLKSLEINERLGLQEGIATACCNLGMVYQVKGELPQAEKMHLKALAIEERQRRPAGLANIYRNLGAIYETQGRLDRAENMLQKSLVIEQQLGRSEGEAFTYGLLGVIYRKRGQLDRAEDSALKALEIEQRMGRQEGMSVAYFHLGEIYLARGDFDKAEDMHLKSLAIDERLERPEGLADNHCTLGEIYLARGELDRAECMVRKSLEINEQHGWFEEVTDAYGSLGFISWKQGKTAKAVMYWSTRILLSIGLMLRSIVWRVAESFKKSGRGNG